MGIRLPHETFEQATMWQQEWQVILADRDAMGCAQSGDRGPPFSTALPQLSQLERWLPWNWYSIDGSGWCYDAGWDDIQRCTQMDAPVDWNGVASPVYPSSLFSVLLDMSPMVVAIGLCGFFAVQSMREDWAAKNPRGTVAEWRSWFRSTLIRPRRWPRRTWERLLGGALGLLCSGSFLLLHRLLGFRLVALLLAVMSGCAMLLLGLRDGSHTLVSRAREGAARALRWATQSKIRGKGEDEGEAEDERNFQSQRLESTGIYWAKNSEPEGEVEGEGAAAAPTLVAGNVLEGAHEVESAHELKGKLDE